LLEDGSVDEVDELPPMPISILTEASFFFFLLFDRQRFASAWNYMEMAM
jgi:hypothetical protein